MKCPTAEIYQLITQVKDSRQKCAAIQGITSGTLPQIYECGLLELQQGLTACYWCYLIYQSALFCRQQGVCIYVPMAQIAQCSVKCPAVAPYLTDYEALYIVQVGVCSYAKYHNCKWDSTSETITNCLESQHVVNESFSVAP